jgi:hypothetical protein
MRWIVAGALSLQLSVTAGAQTSSDQNAATKRAISAFFGMAKATGAGYKSRLLGNLTDPRITESSGIAASRRADGVFWTHNDSGDGPYLFAIDRKGRTLARYTVPEATNVDWEDIALGPGPDGKPAIFIGDIGDNNSIRKECVVYRVPEPLVDTTKTMQERTTEVPDRFTYHYPDGPHDCETLMVHPKTHEIFVVTKDWSQAGVSGVYTFPIPLRPNDTVTLKRIGTMTFSTRMLTGTSYAQFEGMATGGDISPDGRRLVVRTYMLADEWDIKPGQSVADAIKSKPRETLLPLSKQGEGICYRLDGKAWLTTSEGANSPLFEILLP